MENWRLQDKVEKNELFEIMNNYKNRFEKVCSEYCEVSKGK
jgi:hypothetical protein